MQGQLHNAQISFQNASPFLPRPQIRALPSLRPSGLHCTHWYLQAWSWPFHLGQGCRAATSETPTIHDNRQGNGFFRLPPQANQPHIRTRYPLQRTIHWFSSRSEAYFSNTNVRFLTYQAEKAPLLCVRIDFRRVRVNSSLSCKTSSSCALCVVLQIVDAASRIEFHPPLGSGPACVTVDAVRGAC